MGSGGELPPWALKPCIMGIDEAGRGPVLGPMVYGCLYCARSYQKTLSTLNFADSKTLKEEKREELFEELKTNGSIGWAVDVIDPRDLSAKMLKKNKINLNEISHESAMGLVRRALDMGVLLSEVYVDTVGDPDKYRLKLSERFPSIKFVVAKKADSLYPVVSGASIVAKVTRDRALRDWVFDETAENMNRIFGSGYPGDPDTKAWLDHHKHLVFGFPTLVRFSWGTCNSYSKDTVEVLWESDANDEDESSAKSSKRQIKLTSIGFSGVKRKSEDIESSGKGHCKFFQSHTRQRLEIDTYIYMSTVHESHLHDNAADGVGDEDVAVAEASHQGYFDFPPESFWVAKDSEQDWFDQNATMQRKTSLKLGFSGANNNNKKTFSHRSFSTLNHKHKSSSLIALPKSQKSSAAADGNLRQNKAATVRLFRSRSAPGGKRALQQGVEPGSPKVSCTGRVRAKREGGKRTGLWKKLRTVLKNRLGAKRVVNKASSDSAGSMGFESGRWSES